MVTAEAPELQPAADVAVAEVVLAAFDELLGGTAEVLQLPPIRQCFEKAREAERETLSYERYLLELAEHECQECRENCIARLLHESKLPLEKTLENFDLTT